MPLEPPAAVDVAVVLVPEQCEPAEERCSERDVRERAADEVVAAAVRPVEPMRETEQEHRRIYSAAAGRNLRHSRSPLATKKPNERKGSAGRPPTWATFATTTVAPYMKVVANHVQTTRS